MPKCWGGQVYSTIDSIYYNLDRKVFVLSTRVNVALFDAIMVGIATRLKNGEITNEKLLQQRYYALLKDAKFYDACKSGTTDENSIKYRIDEAIKAFADVD